MLLLDDAANAGPPPSLRTPSQPKVVCLQVDHVPAFRDSRLAGYLVAAVFAVVAGLISHGTFAGSGDEPHYLTIAHSIAFDRDLDLTNNYRDAALIGGESFEPGAHVVEKHGRLLPVHDIGMPLAMAPVVRAAYGIAERLPQSFLDATDLTRSLALRHLISLVMALLTALLAREMFLVIRLLGGSPRTAFLWSLLFAVTPPVLAHAFLFFTEIPSALITLFVFRRLRLQPIESIGAAMMIGALAGYLVLIHIRNVGIVVGLMLIALPLVFDRSLPMRRFLGFAAAALMATAARTWITFWLWGTYLTTPHAAAGHTMAMSATIREMFERTSGLLFDRYFGLIAYAPIYLMALAGLVVLWRDRARLSRDVMIVASCYLVPVLLPIINVHGWTGGWSPAARFLLPIAPLLWMGVYCFAARASAAGRIVIALIVTVQCVMDAYIWQHPKTLWRDEDGSIFFPGSLWLPAWTDSGAAILFALLIVAAGAWTMVCLRIFARSSPSAPAPNYFSAASLRRSSSK
jgi:hypothetical protein